MRALFKRCGTILSSPCLYYFLWLFCCISSAISISSVGGCAWATSFALVLPTYSSSLLFKVNLWKNWRLLLSLRFLYPRTVESDDIVTIYLVSGSIDTPYTIFLCPSNVWTLLNFPPTALHRIHVPSTEHEAKCEESRAQHISITSPTCPLSCLGWPHYTVSSVLPNSAGKSFRDQITTIWSSEPEAKYCPLGENLTTLTVEVCPLYRSYLYSGTQLPPSSLWSEGSHLSSQNYRSNLSLIDLISRKWINVYTLIKFLIRCTYSNASVLILHNRPRDQIVRIRIKIYGHNPCWVIMPKNLRDVHVHL